MSILTSPQKASCDFVFDGKLRIIAPYKCGLTSVDYTLRKTNVRKVVRLHEVNIPAHEKVVMIVRDPIKRIPSLWNYFCNSSHALFRLSRNLGALGAYKNMPFSEFVDLVVANKLRDRHILPLVYYKGNRDIYKYMLTDNLAEHWAKVVQPIMALPELKKMNTGEWSQDGYSSYYSDADLAKIQEAYAEDIQLYNEAVAVCATY